MDRKLVLSFILMFLISLAGQNLLAQNVVTGKIRDTKTNEPLIGVNVVVKGTTENTLSDVSGEFELKTEREYPITIELSYLGYTKQEATVKDNRPVLLKLATNEVQLKEATVRSTRITEREKESPLTIETLDMVGIKETPAVNFYEGLGQLKGVDLVSASLGFKVINTRGFNSTSPVRSLQIIDGVDNQSPGLNFSLGNFLGSSELDVQKVELVVGASSAYYGPNAFNGVISMKTRSPFTKPGLEVSVKVGERELFETALRWAQVIKNKKGEDKFGYKFNFFHMRAKDWEADNLSATPQSKSDVKNPGGYDAVNVYGDEFIFGTDYTNSPGSFPGLGIYYRKGYHEKALVDYNTNNTKLGLALHYKLTPATEVILASNYGGGTTIFQGDNRYSLKDIKFYQNRVEVRKEDKWFIRAYATNEDAGKSYDAYFTALLLQRAAKSEGDWKVDYENYWNNHYGLPFFLHFDDFPKPPTPGPEYVAWLASINPFLYEHYYDSLVAYHQLTQAYASGVGFDTTNHSFFEPGSYEFDTAFAGITSRKTFGENGSRFFDKSALYHLQGEYKFKALSLDFTAGGNYRLYRPNSQGTIFSDTNGVKIQNSELGLYAGAEKRMADDKMKLNATLRMDKNENFPYLFSPAVSAVYQPAKEQYVRLSFSSAIRNPTLTDQYLYYQVGRAILIGNINGFKGLVTIPSLISAYDANSNFDSLHYFDVDPVQPEKVKTIEGGYKALLFEHLYLDVSAYYSWYKDFIGYKIGATVDTQHVQGGIPVLRLNRVYRVATNSKDEVTTSGVSIGLSYYFGKHFACTGNYSWNKLDRHGSTDPLIPAFNTPEHKFNIGVNGRDIKNFGFNVNYKYVSGFTFEGSPQFTGPIDSYGIVDIQVNRRFPKMYTTLKIGASNLLNNKHYEVYGGPLVGRLAYCSLLVELNGVNK
jgi:iron complex outermembrane recepter protein